MIDRVLALAMAIAMASSAAAASAQEPRSDVPTPRPPAMALHLAALQGNANVIRQHAAAGTDATTFGRTEAARALVEAGADLTIGNAEASTPLHVAAFLGRSEIAGVLLELGADPHTRNDDGASAYDMAVVPVAYDRPLLDQLRAGLGPLGLELDDGRIEAGRAATLDLLRSGRDDAAVPAFAPRPAHDWPVSTPPAEGLDPALVADLYADAAELEALRGLLIVKNGRLVAERYFNGGAIDQPTLVQSVTKSITSALVGIALEQGCLESVDRRMLGFFPEQAVGVRDPRKRRIRIRHMLQMRAGYGWEGSDSVRWQGLIGGDYLPLIIDFPLDREPGTGFDYSNVTSHLLGVIVARACDTDLLSFARQHLFGPVGMSPGDWRADPYGYRYGQGELHLTARDMARFGLLYLSHGTWDGRNVVPADWVGASLIGYSAGINTAGLRSGTVGRYFRDAGYGYQWWSARVGDRRFDFAWGHGGQMIILLEDLDMVIVVISDPFHRPIREDHEAWRHEQANFNLVGKFIRSLPEEGVEP